MNLLSAVLFPIVYIIAIDHKTYDGFLRRQLTHPNITLCLSQIENLVDCWTK